MINEKLEYEQYTDPNHEKRLLSELITIKNMAGVPRALTIIARKELADRNYWKNNDPEERGKIREEVTEVLKEWCFNTDASSLINRVFINDPKKNNRETESDYEKKKKGNIENITKEISNKLETKKGKNSWSSEDIYHPLHFEKPNIFAVNFPRIISTAISYGPLKQYLLSCDKLFFDDLYINRLFSITTDNYEKKDIPVLTKNNDPTHGKPAKRYRDYTERLFKLIAVYKYTSKINHDGNSKVYIGSGEAANWMKFAPFCKGSHPQTYYFKEAKNDIYIPVFENKYGWWEMNSIIQSRYNFEIKEYKDENERRKKENGYKTIEKKKCRIYDLKDGLKYPDYEEFIQNNKTNK